MGVATEETVPRILIARGLIHARLRQFRDAQSDFRDAVTTAERRATASTRPMRWANWMPVCWFVNIAMTNPSDGQNARSKLPKRKATRPSLVNLRNLGWCYYRLGDFDNAGGISKSRSSAWPVRADYANSSRPVGNIGSLRYSLGDYRVRVRYYQKALGLAESFGQRNGWARWLNNLAATYLEAGDPGFSGALQPPCPRFACRVSPIRWSASGPYSTAPRSRQSDSSTRMPTASIVRLSQAERPTRRSNGRFMQGSRACMRRKRRRRRAPSSNRPSGSSTPVGPTCSTTAPSSLP